MTSLSGIFGLLLLACAGQGACPELPQSAAAAAVLEGAEDELGWTPVLPCTTSPGLRIESARVMTAGGEPALTLAVFRGTERRYLVTQSTADPRSTAIPTGTHTVEVHHAGLRAWGFDGPDGSGGNLMYLRFEVDGRFIEYQADITPQFPRRDAYRALESLMERSAGTTSGAAGA